MSRPLRIGDKAPLFVGRSTLGQISLDQFQGRWLVFFCHPADFTPVCTSELIALARAASRFEVLNCALLGLSIDSLYAHIAWVNAIYKAFNISVPFPIVEDSSMAIANAYGMLDDTANDSATLRAIYFIDPEGIIRAISCYPLNVGFSVAEILRLVAALQHTTAMDVMTPEGWKPGDPTLLPPISAKEALMKNTPAGWFCQTRPVS